VGSWNSVRLPPTCVRGHHALCVIQRAQTPVLAGGCPPLRSSRRVPASLVTRGSCARSSVARAVRAQSVVRVQTCSHDGACISHTLATSPESAETAHLEDDRHSPFAPALDVRALRRRSGHHDPAGRWRRRMNRIRPGASAGRPRVGADVCNPCDHVAHLLDPRLEQLRAWRDAPVRGRPEDAQAASTGRNRCSSAARGSAPTTRSISCPSRITTSNGIDCAPNLVASPGFASTSTFTTFRCPK
jgi:hypothetical protein